MGVIAIVFMLLTALAALYFVLRIFDAQPERPEPEWDENGLEKPLGQFHRPGKLTRRDGLAMLLITALCAVLGYWNLGDTRGVVSWATFERAGDAAELRLSEPAELSRIQYYTGATVGDWLLEWSPDGETWRGSKTLEQGYNDILKWQDFAPEEGFGPVKALRLTARMGDLTLGEIALRDKEGQLLSFETDFSALHDEQSLAPQEASWRSGVYFDEIYHVRTAWEHLTERTPYEVTHPPLGKELMGLGIRLFGMTPFGWRFSGVLFGVLMLPLLYLLLQWMLGNTLVSASVTAIFALDFMHFAQTRLATIDTYGVFFTLLMYLFFYRYYTQPWDTPLRKTLPPLALSGACFALGTVTKWTCIFAGGGLAVLWCLRQAERLRRRGFREELGTYLLPTVGWSCVFFLLFPVLAYLLCYIPYARAAGTRLLSPEYPRLILANIRYMYRYHADLEATHPYQSLWWQWVLDLRPILYYLRYENGYALRSSIGACGNPLFWWTGLGTMVCMLVKGLRGDRLAWFVLLGYLSTLLPWVTVERCAFIYHYFPCTVFLALALGRCLRDCARRRLSARDVTAPVLAGCCGVLFAVFYPALSGLLYSADYGNALLGWFGGAWPF